MLNKLKNFLYQFLKKTEKYTQTDMIYLAKGGFWLTLGQIISTATSFLLAVAFANLLDPVTYGNYRYVLSLVGILTIFTLTGMETAVTQVVARGLEGSFYTGFKTKFKWGFLGSVAVLGLAGYYLTQRNYILSIPLLLSAIFLPLMQASGVYSGFLTGRKLFNIEVKYSSLCQIFSALSLILTLFLTKNLLWLIAIYFVSNTLANYFCYLLTKRKFQPNKKEDSEALSFGKNLSLMGVLDQIAFYIDRILVFHYLGAVEVAIYQFAIAPPEQIKGLLKNIQPLAMPKFAQREKEEIKRTIFKKALKFSLFLLPIVIIYILVAPFLYKFLFPQYLNSIFYSQILAISLLIMPAIYLNEAVLQSQKAQKQLYQFNILGSVIQIILLFFLIHFYGLMGAIIAKVIYRFINLGLSAVLVKKI